MKVKELSLNETCKILGISLATGKNWLRLNKLMPLDSSDLSHPVFDYDYIMEVKTDLESGLKKDLKSRRNKKYVSGFNLYKNYVDEGCKGVTSVESSLNYLVSNKVEVTCNILNAVLMDAAIQMVSQVFDFKRVHLYDFLKETDLRFYSSLILDNIKDIDDTLRCIEKHPQLFDVEYSFEDGQDILGLLYLSCKNVGERKTSGSYYTPNNIVCDLIDNLGLSCDCSETTILDPCCGTGNFLLQLPKNIQLKNLYGNDIDPISIAITRINMLLKYRTTDIALLYKNFTISDYLLDYKNNDFDYIIGNPPWGAELDKSEIVELSKRYRTIRHDRVESFAIFLEKSIDDTNETGSVSFVVPEAILNVEIHQQLRQIILDKTNIQYINFLGNAFSGVQCPCIILQLHKSKSKYDGVGTRIKTKKEEFTIKEKRDITPYIFCLSINDTDYKIFKKIDNLKNAVYLKDNSTFALGIVTGNNDFYISNSKNPQNEIVLTGSDIYKFKFKPSGKFIAFDRDKFQQVAADEYYRAPEKLLYRFICNHLVFAYDDKQTLSLNSCNILIPQFDNLSCKYILAILNSRISQYYFRKKFNSVKVLRSHIESIPIPNASKDFQNRIETYVNRIIATNISEEILNLYNQMDIELAKIYGLSKNEYQKVVESMSSENNFLS